MTTNKHGLSRDIPAEVKRQVRQRCAFGCVICGGSIIEYEHVDPPFADAHAHNPASIALLCPTCHAKVTRGFLSKDAVLQAMLNPCCARTGFASELFEVGMRHPVVVFASATLRQCLIPVEVKGTPLIMIEAPEADPGPFRVSANFHNSRGQPSLRVVQNEWQALSSNWDVEVSAGTITVRDAPSHVSLRLMAIPGNGFRVDSLDMFLHGWHIQGNADTLLVNGPGIVNTRCSGFIADNCKVGIAFD